MFKNSQLTRTENDWYNLHFKSVMFQSDGTNFNIMILEELSDIGFLELYRIVSNIDLMFSPGNKKL